ncbi:hypothetical protein F0344_05350 [Streptomyces finlayi]|uniref:DUF4280 domain-containing protein n=1 Tax=Streptomyces finlayi TaxID=67296 RepID=A0A7G7BFJ1_9ACTN|nr:hypothetical protein [Streptomyces finlayi]QNE74106.1 hypothetical protein F0344_05350 [Streptomyces finlayi]
MSTSSGTIVSAAATLHCPHGGRASATSARSAVRLDGLPVHTASDTFVVTGCPHTVDGVPHPCTTVRWSPQTGGVLIDGAPVLLHTSAANCFSSALVPQGPPVVTAARQGATCR